MIGIKYSAFTLTPVTDDCRGDMIAWALVKVLEGIEEIKLAPHEDDISGLEDTFLRGVLPDEALQFVPAARLKLRDAVALRDRAQDIAKQYYGVRFAFRDQGGTPRSSGDYEVSGDSYDGYDGYDDQKYDFDDAHDQRYLDFISLVADYGVQFHYAYQLNKSLYRGVDTLTLHELGGFLKVLLPQMPVESLTLPELLCRNMYFSVEAAYTQGAVNVIVHEMQGGKRLDLDRSDYLCSIIENYGELLKHVSAVDAMHEPPLADKAVKYSKYVYRILYAMGKYHGRQDLMDAAKRVKDEVVSKRGGKVVAGTDLSKIFFADQQGSYDYLVAVSQGLKKSLAFQAGGARAASNVTAWLALAAVTVAAAFMG